MEDGQFRAVWKDGFAVGDALIDAQHRAFFDEINAVAHALDQGQGRDAVIHFYCDFTAGLTIHFADEEELMERTGFPGLDDHRQEHQRLLEQVAAVQAMLFTGDDVNQWQLVVKSLFTALVDHLIGTDMRYKSHVMRTRGL